jgi:hypothetical protein
VSISRDNSKNKGLTDRQFETIRRSFDVIARMRRDDVSLNLAARQEGLTPATVLKLLPNALRQDKKGRWVATASDSYYRFLSLPGPQGPVTVRAKGSEEAQLASEYLQAIKSGKRSQIALFEGKSVGGLKLVTSPRTLAALRDAGFLQLDSLYASLKETR